MCYSSGFSELRRDMQKGIKSWCPISIDKGDQDQLSERWHTSQHLKERGQSLHKKREPLSANMRHQEKYCLLEKYRSTFWWWPSWMWRTSWEKQTKTRPWRTLQPIFRTVRRTWTTIFLLNPSCLLVQWYKFSLLTTLVIFEKENLINFQWNGKKKAQQTVPSNILVVSHTVMLKKSD